MISDHMFGNWFLVRSSIYEENRLQRAIIAIANDKKSIFENPERFVRSAVVLVVFVVNINIGGGRFLLLCAALSPYSTVDLSNGCRFPKKGDQWVATAPSPAI